LVLNVNMLLLLLWVLKDYIEVTQGLEPGDELVGNGPFGNQAGQVLCPQIERMTDVVQRAAAVLTLRARRYDAIVATLRIDLVGNVQSNVQLDPQLTDADALFEVQRHYRSSSILSSVAATIFSQLSTWLSSRSWITSSLRQIMLASDERIALSSITLRDRERPHRCERRPGDYGNGGEPPQPNPHLLSIVRFRITHHAR
jgi:hypothetical protein